LPNKQQKNESKKLEKKFNKKYKVANHNYLFKREKIIRKINLLVIK
jgi:hypothetical protein